MLNLARIEAGVVLVNKQSRSLNELLDEALTVMQPAAEAKGVTLVSDLSPLYLGVYVDHDMALQAAINLLSNAVKYTPAGGQVTLRSRLADHPLMKKRAKLPQGPKNLDPHHHDDQQGLEAHGARRNPVGPNPKC